MALMKAKTENGWVEGLPAGNQAVSVFKGIPFAAPPVGELRWKAPAPCTNWEGVLKAYSYGNIPMQSRVAKGSFYQKEFYPIELPRREDCLYLNIWTPAKSADEKLPVAVWVFGGALLQGYSNKQEFDGEAFAKRGVVFVSISYRLGIFGFMASKELTAENAYGGSGNYGFLDQVAAIKWIRRNIASFGGDPEKLTVFGQSAGACSTGVLTTSDLTRTDIHQAIMQSTRSLFRGVPMDECEAYGDGFLKYCNIPNITQARALDGETLLALYEKYTREVLKEIIFPFSIDGYVIKDSPLDTVKQGKGHKISYMIGSNLNEGPVQPQQYPKDVTKFRLSIEQKYGEKAREFFEIYPADTLDDILKFTIDTHGSDEFALNRAWCELQTRVNEKPAFLYRFTKPAPGDDNPGAFHSAEHAYVFQTLLRINRPYDGSDYKLSNTMCDYWTNFIKTGDPNGNGLPVWKPFYEAKDQYMELGDEVGMKPVPYVPAVEFEKEYLLN